MNKISNDKKLDLTHKIKTSYSNLIAEIGKIIVGQEKTIDSIITALLCNGHCLLIGVPGLAKTLIVKTVSKTLDLNFNRIQFTPDLMPADILGSDILQIDKETKDRYFKFSKGPIFTNILLADEINRTPPKTQSALLESMQELSVTAGGQKYELDKPFLVLATQNPIEQEGTYPLPEAQLDRFMFSIKLNYPSFEEESVIIKNTTFNLEQNIENVFTKSELLETQKIIRDILISDELINFILNITRASRPETTNIEEIKKNVNWGAGPRASQYITLAAKASALLNGRLYCIKEDVLKNIYNVLGHRIILNFNAAASNISVENIIDLLIKECKKNN
ncbi:MoxR family ATPase [Candidatus Dependentiae bacterium]|nr:MoxR family ATPase [Candidatus Dependentiae bacterium]